MTREQLALLQRSAQLCAQYNDLHTQIQALNNKIANVKKQIIDDPHRAGTQAAKAYVEKESPAKPSSFIFAFLAAAVPYIILGGLAELSRIDFLSFLALAVTVGTFILVYIKINKKYKAQVYAQYRAKCIEEYTRQTQDAQDQLAKLQAQLTPLQAQYIQLQHTMNNRTECCVPSQYWAVGVYLCQMVETGQVNTLDQAITCYEGQLRDKQLADMQKAAADAARWNELTAMMNSNVAGELDKKRAAQTRDAIEDMAMIELMDQI